MKILWITNITFPEANSLLGGNGQHKESGGWMLSTAESLVRIKDIKLYVTSVSPLVSSLTCIMGKDITYFIIPRCSRIKDYDTYMRTIRDKVNPDIVHLHGTELPYGWSWLNACPSDNVVVSIQGITSAIARYYLSGLTTKEIIMSITIRDILRKTLYGERKDFYDRGRREIEVLKKVNFIVGRTSFDYAHCKSINPSATYFHCEETLRSEFYSGEWIYESCTPHTIFVSQASYPIKGLHMLLKALSIIKEVYPDVKIRVAGEDIVNRGGFRGRLLQTGYGKLLRRLMKDFSLDSSVVFTGRLDAEGMKKEYLNANVFLCPSSIENSPNSIGEAQLLGVPVVASYVGGIPDMMRGCEDNLYRFEELEMLAQRIINVFDKGNEIVTDEIKKQAHKRHDANANIKTLVGIYNKIV